MLRMPRVGSIVTFHAKVFGPPWEPYYDDYKGGTYRVVAFHEGNHIELEPLHGSAPVQGYVHADELEVLP